MEKLKGNIDIIIIGQQPWDTEIGSNCKDIALEFSRDHRVLYVNSPLDRITVMRNRNDSKVRQRLNVIKGKQTGINKVKENLWTYYPDCIVESINWINNTRIFNVLNKVNNRRFAFSIQKAIKTLEFSDYYLFNDSEMFKGFYLKEYLKPALSIYYSRDFMIGVNYWKKHGEKLEPELIRKSDLCVTNSAYLEDYCKQYNLNSYNVGQGFNSDEYVKSSSLTAAVIPNLQSKVVGYVGALNSSRLNIELLTYLAATFPTISFLLVGGEDEAFKQSKLHHLDNVLFLGQRPVEELASLVNMFDICINPQLVNALTVGNYPRKIDEYLSLGKPVIATRTRTMEDFKELVYLADTKEEYAYFIEHILTVDQSELEEQRRLRAVENSWEASVNKIYKAINLILASE